MKEKETYPGEEQNSLDNLFRNSLKGYEAEPPARIWQNINRKMLYRELLRLNFTNFPRRAAIGFMAGVSLIIGLFFFFTNAPEKKPSATTETVNSATEAKAIGKPVEQPLVNATPETVIKTLPESTSSSVKLSKSSIPGVFPTGTGIITEDVSMIPDQKYSTTSSQIRTNVSFLKIPSLSTPELWLNQHPGFVLSITDLKTHLVIPRFFSASIGITPEYTSLKSSSTSSKSEYTYWARLGLSYHYSRFSLNTGLAYGYSTNEAKYRVNYRSNDSIGFFTSIVSFYVNPLDPSEIIFNTKTLAVFDSIDHLTDDRARSRYTYLTVPLLVGYDILQTDRLTVTLQAGPAITFLIGKKEAEPYIDYPGARIIRIDSERPVKVKTSWKVLSALHFDYRLTKGFSIYAEPSFSYFLKTTYENNELPAEKPWSVGVGLGIKYNFGKGLSKKTK